MTIQLTVKTQRISSPATLASPFTFTFLKASDSLMADLEVWALGHEQYVEVTGHAGHEIYTKDLYLEFTWWANITVSISDPAIAVAFLQEFGGIAND